MARLRISRRQALACGAAATLLPALSGGQAAVGAWARQKRYLQVNGQRMAVVEMGQGAPILFLHGNPTSSFLWRNIMPHVQHLGRCVAPDMVGMGDSDPLPDSGPGRYTFLTQRDFLFAMFEQLGLDEPVTLVIHDWGSAMGFSWAMRFPERVRGIAYMEAIVRPPDMQEQPATGGFFERLRSSAGEQMVLEDNMFVERLLLGGLKYYLSEEERAEYRRPYEQPGESRRPTLTWPRELPLSGEPRVNDEIIKEYSIWLKSTPIPKLFVRAEPGAIFRAPAMLDYVRSFANQTEVMVYGGHFLQEVSPDAIGRALAEWLATIA